MPVQFPNIFNCEITHGPVIERLYPLFYANKMANRIGAYLFMNGRPFVHTGTVVATAVLTGGYTVRLDGNKDGNLVYVDLSRECYMKPGPIQVYITCVNETEPITTVLVGLGKITLTETNTLVDPAYQTTLSVVALENQIAELGTQIVYDAEAWAKGTKGGTAVESSDPTYHNNAKYYSEQIADSAAIAVSAKDAAVAAAATASAAYDVNLLAPNYTDLEPPIKAGQFCIYSGGLYRAKVDIDVSESWTPAHWETAALGEDVADLKGASDYYAGQLGLEIEPIVRFTNGKGINFSNGKSDNEGSGGSSRSYSDYISVDGFDNIELMMLKFTSSTNYGIAFYTAKSESSFISGSGIREIYNASSAGYGLRSFAIPATAKYCRTTWCLSSAADYSAFSCKLTKKGVAFDRGLLSDLGITALIDCHENGVYRSSTSYTASITDLPEGYTSGAFDLHVTRPALSTDYIAVQRLCAMDGNKWERVIQCVSSTWGVLTGHDWKWVGTDVSVLRGEIEKAAGYKTAITAWEQGALRQNGDNYDVTVRIRTPLIEKIVSVVALAGYEFAVYGYAEDGTYLGLYCTDGTFKTSGGTAAYLSSIDLLNIGDGSAKKFRIVLRNATTPTADISVSEGANCVFAFIGPDASLTVNGAAADAYACGNTFREIAKDKNIVRLNNTAGSYAGITGAEISGNIVSVNAIFPNDYNAFNLTGGDVSIR